MPASTRPHHDCRQEAEGHGLAEKPPWDSGTQHSRISANYRPAEARWWEVSTQRRPGTDNEANDNAADLVAHFAVALGRAKSRRTALLDMVGEDGAQRIQNRNPLKALPELTAAEHEGARQFLFRLLYLMYRAQDRAPRD